MERLLCSMNLNNMIKQITNSDNTLLVNFMRFYETKILISLLTTPLSAHNVIVSDDESEFKAIFLTERHLLILMRTIEYLKKNIRLEISTHTVMLVPLRLNEFYISIIFGLLSIYM